MQGWETGEQWLRLRLSVAGKHKYPSWYTLESCKDKLQGRVISYLSSGKENIPLLTVRPEWRGRVGEGRPIGGLRKRFERMGHL